MSLRSDLLRLARQRRVRQQELARRATAVIGRLWSTVDPRNALASWRGTTADAAMQSLSVAQFAGASGADEYVAAALAAQGINARIRVRTVATAFAGIASDGRPLDTLLEQPAVIVDDLVAEGMAPRQAFQAGADSMLRIVATQVADAARVANGVATAASRADGYIRMLTPPSCSRCIILAGVWYEWNAGFERHPLCDCVHIPAAEDTADEILTNPTLMFESMTPAEQDRVFTIAGARAIRNGADMAQVVNARRGARGLTPAGARITAQEALILRGGRDRGHLERVDVFGHQLFTTTEGRTVRGLAGKRLSKRGTERVGRYRSAKAARLMPESIYELAGADRAEALRLLRYYGYII